MSPQHCVTLVHPTPAGVGLVDGSPREIVLTLGQGIEVELWPGADDHTDQEAWIEATQQALHRARILMRSHRPAHRSERTGETGARR